MTADNIKYLKSQYLKDNGEGKTLAQSVFYISDNTIIFRNNCDFVIFDDEHELIHCIAANNHPTVRHEAPFTITTTEYQHLQFIDANLTLDALDTVLNSMFKSLIPANQIEAIMKWAKALPCHFVDPNLGNYFQEDAPTIPRQLVSPDMYPIVKKEKEEAIIPPKFKEEDPPKPPAPTVSSIRVNSTTHKNEYTVGDTALDVENLTIEVTMSDGSKKTVNVTTDMVAGFDSTTAVDKQNITITYEGKTTTLEISIKAKPTTEDPDPNKPSVGEGEVAPGDDDW